MGGARFFQLIYNNVRLVRGAWRDRGGGERHTTTKSMKESRSKKCTCKVVCGESVWYKKVKPKNVVKPQEIMQKYTSLNIACVKSICSVPVIPGCNTTTRAQVNCKNVNRYFPDNPCESDGTLFH